MRRCRPTCVLHPGAVLAAACALMLLVLAEGCASSSPRYRSSPPERTAETRGSGTAVAGQEDDPGAAESRVTDTRVPARPVPRPPGRTEELVDDTPAGMSRDRVLLDIVSFLGTPYRMGGTSTDGVDCSGFISRIYADAAGMALPRLTTEQYEVGEEVDRDELRFGDLVFFNTTGRSPSHVGIYLENDLFAHASSSEGVTLSSLRSAYYKKRYIGARRVMR